MQGRRIGLLAIALAVFDCGPAPVPPTAHVAAPTALISSTTSAAPTASPDAAGSATPGGASPPPVPRPSPTATPPASVLGVARIPFAGRTMVLTVAGTPGIVERWRPATTAELRATGWDGDAEIILVRRTDRELLLAWIGTVCDVEATLVVARDSLVVAPAPREACDLVGVGRGVVLTFARPTDPAAMSLRLEPPQRLPGPT